MYVYMYILLNLKYYIPSPRLGHPGEGVSRWSCAKGKKGQNYDDSDLIFTRGYSNHPNMCIIIIHSLSYIQYIRFSYKECYIHYIIHNKHKLYPTPHRTSISSAQSGSSICPSLL